MAKTPRKRFDTGSEIKDYYKYKWDDFEAYLRFKPSWKEWSWVVDSVQTGESLFSGYASNTELKDAKGAEDEMMFQISERIGITPKSQVGIYADGGQVKKYRVRVYDIDKNGVFDILHSTDFITKPTQEKLIEIAKEYNGKWVDVIRNNKIIQDIDLMEMKMAKGGRVELIFHGSSREIPMGEFETSAAAKRYVESSDWKRPYSIKKIEPKVARTQFEEEVFEYADGGAVWLLCCTSWQGELSACGGFVWTSAGAGAECGGGRAWGDRARACRDQRCERLFRGRE
jgi:hypothetical protein